MGPLVGQTIVVENRGGAAGIVAGQQVSRAEPDGYTVLIATNSMIIAQPTNANSGLNITRDLRAVASVAPQANIVVASPGLDVSSLKDLIRLAKLRNLTYSSPGSGSVPQLLFEQLFTTIAQAPMTHVPFPGAAPALTATMSNQTDVGIVTLPPAVDLNAGKLKGIVVTTPDRSAALPKIPTAVESGYPGISSAVWTAFFVPAKTPPGVSARLGEAILKAAAMPDIQAKLHQLGYELTTVPGEQFQRDVAKELGMWAEMLGKAGATG
jgi:tripartite-type tricarboxylate transporter receptor subunit TctC